MLQEGNFFFRVIEEIELDIAVDEAAEFDADEADELSTFIDIGEELKRMSDECTSLRGIRYAALLGEGVEVGIADLDGDATGEPGILTKVEGEFIHHGTQHTANKFHVKGILAERAFFGH